VRADEKLSAFVELEREVLQLPFISNPSPDSVRRRESKAVKAAVETHEHKGDFRE